MAYSSIKDNSSSVLRHSLITEDDTNSTVDNEMNILVDDNVSPVTVKSMRDSALSDDLRDLDIIPIGLKTDPGNF